MNELERRLAAAFAAQARDAIDEHRTPPPFPTAADAAGGIADLDTPDTKPGELRRARTPRRWTTRVAPLAAAAAVLVVVAGAVALRDSDHPPVATGTAPVATHPSALVAPVTRPAPVAGSGTPVSLRSEISDNSTVGVGMPVIVLVSKQITDAKSFDRATTATVNGTPVDGAWYFQESTARAGFPLEAHFRLEQYWPAHAAVQVKVAAKGITAGTGLVFADDVSTSFRTGAANIVTVLDAKHELTVQTDGRTVATYPASMGAAITPTTRGIKVIMAKEPSICLSGPGYEQCGIKFTQRLTTSGEYLLAAPWAEGTIGAQDTSNGATYLAPAAADQLYGVLRVGDVVQYPDAPGPMMAPGMGYGDWNVPWSTWLKGGAVPTR